MPITHLYGFKHLEAIHRSYWKQILGTLTVASLALGSISLQWLNYEYGLELALNLTDSQKVKKLCFWALNDKKLCFRRPHFQFFMSKFKKGPV